jgi:cell division protein FtsN
MSSAECATESNSLTMDAEPSPAPPAVAQTAIAEQARKRVFLSFAGTCVVGLALAGWYVGDRIFAADTEHTSAAPAEAIVQPANIPMPVPPPAAFVIPAPVPKPPELYLQTAALGDKQDLKFLKQLKLKGYVARVDQSNAEDDRILIGPYADSEALERARRKLAGAGILAAETFR